MAVLHEQLLAGRTIATSGGGATGALGDLLVRLGASVCQLELPSTLQDEQRVELVRGHGPIDALHHDAGGAFGAGGGEGLTAALEESWRAVAAVANGALIPAKAGKVVLTAPRPDAGAHADAAREALENLARTLSVEWARYGITTSAILPGRACSADDLGELVAFLVSPAGEYYSGCRFELV